MYLPTLAHVWGENVIPYQSERKPPLVGATNFRDAGGYASRDGRRIKWGRVYRSDSLARLTDEDLSHVDTLGIRLICDFRRDEERDDAPSRFPANTPEVVHFNVGPKRSDSKLYKHFSSEKVNAEDIRRAMVGLYQSFVTEYQESFAEFLRLVVEAQNLPLLFHCTAGKDRTGFAAAILLSALDVPHETIMEDYVLTNEHYERDPSIFSHLPSPEVFHTVMSADPEYMRASFVIIDKEFGGVQAYLRNGLGLEEWEIEALRANLLE